MMISKKALMEIAMCLVLVVVIFVMRAGELHFMEGMAGASAFRQAMMEATGLGVIFFVGMGLVLLLVFIGGGFRKK